MPALDYQYQPLSHAREMRLLHLKPPRKGDDTLRGWISHEHLKLDNSLKYLAISYAWGLHTLTDCIDLSHATHEPCRISIAANCAAALKQIRRTSTSARSKAPIAVWIDAICINQRSNDEKNHQIALMYEIYHRADRVVVPLSASVPAGYRGALMFVITAVLKSEAWSSRIWVVQEVLASSEKLTFEFGSSRMSFAEVPGRYASDGTWGRRFPAHERLNPVVETVRWFKSLSAVLTVRSDDAMALRLFYLLIASNDCLPTDPRDKVFVLLRIFRPPHSFIQPNYNQSVDATFLQTSQVLLDRIGPLALTTSGGDFPTSPSWVTNWSRRVSLSPLVSIEERTGVGPTVVLGTFATLQSPETGEVRGDLSQRYRKPSFRAISPSLNGKSLLAGDSSTGSLHLMTVSACTICSVQVVETSYMKTIRYLEPYSTPPILLRWRKQSQRLFKLYLMPLLPHLSKDEFCQLEEDTFCATISPFVNRTQGLGMRLEQWKSEIAPRTYGTRIVSSAWHLGPDMSNVDEDFWLQVLKGAALACAGRKLFLATFGYVNRVYTGLGPPNLEENDIITFLHGWKHLFAFKKMLIDRKEY